MEEQVYLQYGAKVSFSKKKPLQKMLKCCFYFACLQIALKSIMNNNYVKVNHNEGNAVARGHHPILYVSSTGAIFFVRA